MKNVYTSDSHILHKNIIKYTNRPFHTVAEMDVLLLENLREADRRGYRIVHLGDVTFDLKKVVKTYGWVDHPENHILILGNHDSYSSDSKLYHECFGMVVGRSTTEWKTHRLVLRDEIDGIPVTVQVSHNPLPLRGVDYALYGHIHNNDPFTLDAEYEEYLRRNPERRDDDYSFMKNDPRYINCCVEVNGYSYRTLEELVNGKA